MNSPIVLAIISSVTTSVVTATLQKPRRIRTWFRKTRWKTEAHVGQWWTRNPGYITHMGRAPDFRPVPWWNTGPYWLNSPPPGYPSDGPGPRDLLGRPMRPDKAGIVPHSN